MNEDFQASNEAGPRAVRTARACRSRGCAAAFAAGSGRRHLDVRRPATGPARAIGQQGVPTSNTNVDIYNGGTATITTTGNTCGNLSLGSTTGSGTIQMTGGSLSVSGSAFVGYSGSGTYSVSGTGNLSAPWEYVGYSGTGNFTQSGGTNTVPAELDLGYNSGSSGTYSLSGSGLLSARGSSWATPAREASHNPAAPTATPASPPTLARLQPRQ